MENLKQAEAELHKAKDFLAGRGIGMEVARSLHFGYERGRVVMPTFVGGALAAVKFRAIGEDTARGEKWRKWTRDPGVYSLFGVNEAAAPSQIEVFVVESELDAVTVKSIGYNAVSVDSANHQLSEPDIALLRSYSVVFIATDMDQAGNRCAEALQRVLPRAIRLLWNPEAKDIGELYAQDPSSFAERFKSIWQEALSRPPAWRERFHTVDELPEGEIKFLIDGFLPEGVNSIGAHSGVGKTWFALSMARALTTGTPFLGLFRVPQPTNVLYLCPEMSARALKRRALMFGISERFYCQTISDGAPLDLSDSSLAAAVECLKAVVFLDTAIRFSNAKDENSASQNAQGLASAIFNLIRLGAQAVVCLHHRAKATATEEMSLENVLRGSGDLGAMCDAVWGLHYDRGPNSDSMYLKESREKVRLLVRCVKARDFPVPDDFRIQLAPFIDEVGDFGVPVEGAENIRQMESDRLAAAIAANPRATKVDLQAATGIGRNRMDRLAKERGWTYDRKDGWSHTHL
jgi:5S rRNA maturation endonuclease (ribonuclease M5)